MKLIIKDEEDRKTVVPIVRDEYAIGRQDGNHIRLTERNVSRKHARLIRQNGQVFIEDLGSYTGVRVNGDRIEQRTRITEGDSIEIGDYFLEIEGAPSMEGDTNPTHLEPPKDKTPPLAVPAPNARTMPSTAATPAAPSGRRDSNATAVIRLSDIQRSGGEGTVRELAPGEQPRIVCIAGQMRGTEFKLRRSVMKFGRTDEGNELVIDHQSISRSHGRFQLDENGWKLYDNKSANGVRVNGDEYEMSPVKPGDTIELGHVKFRFVAPGEAFQLPRESPQAATALDNHAIQAPQKSKTPLIAGGALVVLLIVGAAVYFALPKGPPPPDPKEHCLKGQAAFGLKDWPAAISSLGMAKTLGAKCDFELESLIQQAKNEKGVQEQLDEATILHEEGKFRQVMSVLAGVPSESVYSAEAKLKATEARREGVQKYSDDAQRLLSAGRLDEASQAIDDIAALDPEAAVLNLLRKQLSTAKSAVRERPAAAPVATATPGKSLEERNSSAETLTNDAIRAIKNNEIPKAINLLKQAIAEKPDASHVAKACRSLGIAHARAEQTAEAVAAYKCYLKADPNTAERAKIEQLIKQHGG